MFFLPYFSTTLGPKKYKIFLTLMPTTFHVYFLVPLVSFDIVYMAFNPQLFDVPYCSKNNSCSTNLIYLVFLTCPFDILVKLFVVILSFLFKIHLLLLFPIFHHPWCCLNVFLLSTKLRSSLNNNIVVPYLSSSLVLFECIFVVDKT